MTLKTIMLGLFSYSIFSLSSVFMKIASESNQIVFKILFFLSSIAILGLFSILWQKILQKTNLNKAYFFKATTIIWGIIYGVIIFKEKITITMLIGAIICLIGVSIIMGEKYHE